jgi:hypothetical protein
MIFTELRGSINTFLNAIWYQSQDSVRCRTANHLVTWENQGLQVGVVHMATPLLLDVEITRHG